MDYRSEKYLKFYNIIKDMDTNPVVQEMKKYRQHCECSCYNHCLQVSYYSYRICKLLHLDYVSMARAAFVHDLFLYDWRTKQPNRSGLHAFTHPKASYERASRLFNLNKKEKDIILKHMWPLTVVPPRYLESYIITIVDKYSAIKESYAYMTKKIYSKKMLRYASLFLLVFLIHIP